MRLGNSLRLGFGGGAAGVRLVAGMVMAFIAASPARGQPFLSYDFNTGDLGDFLNPTGIDYCGTAIPTGIAGIDGGELLLTNDSTLGLCVLTLNPSVVATGFPAGRNYRLRVKVNLETTNELNVYVRGRSSIDELTLELHSSFERGYACVVTPQFTVPELPAGTLALVEFDACHQPVQHPEWPGGQGTGYAVVDPGFSIVPGEWYWMEITAEGDDDGGPVLLSARLWPDGEPPPAAAQIIVVDENGLPHTPETLDPAADVQLALGTSLGIGQSPGATCRLDDLSFTELHGCSEAPVAAARSLMTGRASAEGRELAVYEPGRAFDVALALGDVRPAGVCPAATAARIVERAPAGWTVSDVTAGGMASDNTVTWDVALPAGGGGLPTLGYRVTPAAGGVVTFGGEVTEAGSDFTFAVGGESAAASAASVAPVSDFGSIQHWLVLGPYTREMGGPNPGDVEIVRDYLTDGTITQAAVRPRAGDTIETDFGGAAASTGIAADAFDRNPGGIPRWVEWRDFDDADDRIDFESVYGELDDVLCHALVYLEAEADVLVNFGISSDDAVHVLLDGATIHANNVARSALDRAYQDFPPAFPGLGGVLLARGKHTLLVKVFEGTGEHNFRVGFLDDAGAPIPGGPEGVTVSLEPPSVVPPTAQFSRGDCNGDGERNLTDGIFLLNRLFLGGPAPPCVAACNTNGSGTINITSGVYLFNFLFLGGPRPPEPFPGCGTGNAGDAALGCAASTAGCG